MKAQLYNPIEKLEHVRRMRNLIPAGNILRRILKSEFRTVPEASQLLLDEFKIQEDVKMYI